MDNKIRVMLVDDYVPIRKTFSAWLRGYSDMETVTAMKAAGVASYFTKHCNLDTLLSAIRNFGSTK